MPLEANCAKAAACSKKALAEKCCIRRPGTARPWTWLLLLALGGCRQPAPNPPPVPVTASPPIALSVLRPPQAKKLRLALLVPARDDARFICAYQGAQRVAQQMGQVDVQFMGPTSHCSPQAAAQQQVALLHHLMAQKIDGVMLSCADPALLRPAIDAAVAKDIPIVTFDQDSPRSKRATFYGTDNSALGHRLGQDMAQLMNGQGRVAVLCGQRATNTLQERLHGVQQAMAAHPKMHIAGLFYCADDPTQGQQIIAQVTRQQRPDGWILLGNWPLLATHGLDAIMPGKPKVVAVDPLPATWKWIQHGQVQLCLGQKNFAWGEEGLKLLLAIRAHSKTPNRIDAGLDIVTLQTLSFYRQQWEEFKHPVAPSRPKAAAPHQVPQHSLSRPKAAPPRPSAAQNPSQR